MKGGSSYGIIRLSQLLSESRTLSKTFHDRIGALRELLFFNISCRVSFFRECSPLALSRPETGSAHRWCRFFFPGTLLCVKLLHPLVEHSGFSPCEWTRFIILP